MSEEKKQLTYADAGVDIDAGNRAVELMKDSVRASYRPEVIGDLGGFGGLFALDTKKYKEPILVSGTDGVGTKLKFAFLTNNHSTIGQDAVAMCVNDILVQGAEPLFFLDYIAVDKVDSQKVADIVKGVADACRESGCALIGGETAEMHGFYAKDEYDIAGFCVGVVERSKMITGEKVKAGDVLLGLPSSGVHSNGFSLVRKICFDVMKFTVDTPIPEFGCNLGEKLLTPTRLYPRTCLPLIEKFDIHGMVHITGGGFYDIWPCYKHMADAVNHKNKIRQSRRVNRPPRTRTKHHGNLRYYARGFYIAVKNFAVSVKAVNAFLDSGTAGIKQTD